MLKILGKATSINVRKVLWTCNRWLMAPMDRPAQPQVMAYCERLKQRPGFVAHGANGMP